MAKLTVVESTLKKRQFAKLLLDTDRKMLPKKELCEVVGISPNTYDKWAKDPEIANMIAPESWRVSKTTEVLARTNQVTALTTLVDIMENSENDSARTRAAEIMLKYGRETKEASTSSDSDIVRILAQNKPIFVNGNLIFNETERSDREEVAELEVEYSVDS